MAGEPLQEAGERLILGRRQRRVARELPVRDPEVASLGHRPIGKRGQLGDDLGGDRGRRQAGDAAHLDLDHARSGMMLMALPPG